MSIGCQKKNNQKSKIAKLAAGGLLQITEAVINGEIQNGLAIVRPPGLL